MSAFATGAPGCCCCKDIWEFGVGKYRIKSETEIEAIEPFGGRGDYDPINRVSFAQSLQGTAPHVIYKFREQQDADYVLFLTGGAGEESQGALACHPEAEQLYYSYHANGSTDNFIRRIDYDATDDTAILTDAGISTTIPHIDAMVYHRVLDRIYYTIRALDGINQRLYIRYINADGTGKTSIYDIARAADANLIISLELDYINQKVWWCETNSGSRYVKRCNYDGSNVETVFTNAAPFTRTSGVQVSYRDQCLYTFDYDVGAAAAADNDGGLFKREFDYTEIERVVERKTPNRTFTEFRLGCGLETLGASNEG